MTLRAILPDWLVDAIIGLAAYLKGRLDQQATDQAAAQAASRTAEKTVEDAARQVGAMTDDEVSKELGGWRSKP